MGDDCVSADACQPELKRPAGLRLISPSYTETMREVEHLECLEPEAKRIEGPAVDGRDDWGIAGIGFGPASLKGHDEAMMGGGNSGGRRRRRRR